MTPIDLPTHPILTPVTPEEGELKRYEVRLDGILLGYVVKEEGSVTIRVPYRGRHLSRTGKRRPFWYPAPLDRGKEYRSRQETRKDAVACLVPR